MRGRDARVFWLRLAAVSGMVAGLVVLAPLLWAAVRAGVGLLALGMLLAAGWACLQALPYFGERFEQSLLRARLNGARENPIEVLLGQLVERAAQLERYRTALAAIGAQIEGLRGMLEERRAAAPQHDTQKQAAALSKMIAFHAHHLKQLAAAEVALEGYKRHLHAKRFEWSFAQEGKRVLEGLKARDRASILRELLSDEATLAVQSSFDQVFASLAAELQCVEQRRASSAVTLPELTGDPA